MTDYTEQYKQMHRDPNMFKGDAIKTYSHIKELVEQYKPATILDYGCGKGYQYTQDNYHIDCFNGVMPALYDIGVPEYQTMPDGVFDAVISVDVMEHIPEHQLDAVLKEIYSKATKFVFLGIFDKLALKTLPNGENAHCTVHPISWWVELVSNYATVHTVIQCRGTGNSIAVIEK